jgi:hypothetical protein
MAMDAWDGDMEKMSAQDFFAGVSQGRPDRNDWH